jgi:dTDP-glucose 4,6-dehydratase
LRVAVLGSSSFAGSDFVDLLLDANRDEVLGIGRSPQKVPAFLSYARRQQDHFTYRQLDLNDDLDEICATLDAFAPEYVVNFAAQGDDAASWDHPQDFFRTNCVALAALIDRLKSRPYLHRFLQVSSSGVYGNSAKPITEQSRIEPQSPYGVSKAASDMLLLAYHQHFGFPVQIVRPPNVYGPHQQLFRIIPKTIMMLKRGEIVELHGGGNAVRSYLYVRDLSCAMMKILANGATGEAYNVSPDEMNAIRDIVALICRLMGKDVRSCTRDVEDRRGQRSAQALDSTKIRRELGWKPEVSLRSGIEKVLEWIERDWDALAGQPVAYAHKR